MCKKKNDDDDNDEISYLKTEQFFYKNECFASIAFKLRFAKTPAALRSHTNVQIYLPSKGTQRSPAPLRSIDSNLYIYTLT